MTDASQTIKLDASSRLLVEAAQQRGVTCTFFDHKNLVLMTKGSHSWYTCGSRVSLQSSVGKTIADQKYLTKKILQFNKLPTAPGMVISKAEELVQLESLRFPLVMKPIDSRHGKGVVVGIKDLSQAKTEFSVQEEGRILFEETLSGTEYRVVCVNFKFIAAAFRKPAHVVGDGHSSIEQLIQQKNAHPWRGKGHQNNLSVIEIDDVVHANLLEQNLKISDIPPADKEVVLRKTANLSTGGEAWDVTDQVSAENKAIFEQIARVCDLNVVGIDIMCEDITRPITQQLRAGVIEVNASPGLRMHHFPMQGKPRDVAGIIIDFVLNTLSSHAH
jgi:cyanophycin synthetase